MTRIPVNGLYLNVETSGMGPALLLLHGFTGSVETWLPFMPTLARSRTVVAVDLLGHGKSDSPVAAERHAARRLVDDLVRVLDYLDIDAADVLGYSMGGRAALQLALCAPGRVRRLILESTSVGILKPEEREARRAADERLARMIEEDGVESFAVYWESLPLFASQARLPEVRKAQLRALRRRNTAAGLAGSLRGFGAGSVEPLTTPLPRTAPALLIAGAHDEKYVREADRLAALLPGSRVEIIPDAGHAVHLERPDAFVKAVTEFLFETRNGESHRVSRVEQRQDLHGHQVRTG